MTIQVAWWFDVICVFVWHSEWSWDVVSTCVDFSFEGLAPLRHPSLLGGRAWARQAAGLCRVFLFCWWHNVIESSMFEVSMVWQPDNEMKSLRFENHSLSSPGHILPVTIEVSGGILHWNAQGATWMSCVHFATRVVQKTQLTEQAKFKSSKWHSTAPNKKATAHLLILDNLVTSKLVDYLEFHNRGAWCVTGTYDLLAHAETCGKVVQFSWLSDKQHNSNRWQTAGKPHPSQFSPCPKFTIRICRTLKFRTRLVLVHLALSCCVQLCSSFSKIFKV